MKRTASMVLGGLALVLLVFDSSHDVLPNSSAALPRQRSFRFVATVHVPVMPPGSRKLRLWIPLPYRDGYQTISDLKIDSPIGYKVRAEPEYRNRSAFFVIRPDDAASPFDVQVSFDAQRFEHRASLIASNDAPALPAVSTARFLEPDRLVPINGIIGDLSRAETQGATQPVEKARKIYDYIIATMRYDKSGEGWGRGDALWACDSHHGNCTDFHSLFIGMARAAGIPARFEIGFPLPADSHLGKISGYHCWAEFYVQGIGWIPVDASEAWKNPDKRDYFFGAIDENRILFSLGRDIRLNPAPQGVPLNFFVYPYAELDGKPFDGVRSDYWFKDSFVPLKHGSVSTGGH